MIQFLWTRRSATLGAVLAALAMQACASDRGVDTAVTAAQSPATVAIGTESLAGQANVDALLQQSYAPGGLASPVWLQPSWREERDLGAERRRLLDERRQLQGQIQSLDRQLIPFDRSSPVGRIEPDGDTRSVIDQRRAAERRSLREREQAVDRQLRSLQYDQRISPRSPYLGASPSRLLNRSLRAD